MEKNVFKLQQFLNKKLNMNFGEIICHQIIRYVSELIAKDIYDKEYENIKKEVYLELSKELIDTINQNDYNSKNNKPT